MIVADQSETIAFLSRPETWAAAAGNETGCGAAGNETDGEAVGNKTDGEAVGNKTDGEAVGNKTDGKAVGNKTDGKAVGNKTDGKAVEAIETHASILFLVGDRAYKLKRAVRFPYLDFSTLERRQAFCEAEVRINRRTAGDLYRGTLAVVRRPDGTLALGGDGDVVEWLVEMQRFDQEALFVRLAAVGRLDRFAMESLADTVAGFHAAAEPKPKAGGAAGLAAILDNNRDSFRVCPPALLDPRRVAALDAASRRHLDALATLLDQRRDQGFVRHCHGDLHLRNIVVHQGRAVPFDAIEFDPTLADIDVLYDVAFLVMDLEFRGLRGLASIFLNRYLDDTGDAGGLAALPLFLSMRAAIRSHIEAAASASQSHADAAEPLARDAVRYLELAHSALLPGQPRLIAVGGLSGSGKSRLARELAPCLPPSPGARVVRTDSTRKRLAGVALGQRLPQHSYDEAVTRQTYLAVLAEARAILSAGRPVILDAVFARPEERAAAASLAAELGVPFQGFWLYAEPRILEERVTGRRNNVSDATPEVVRMQLTYDLGPIDWARLDTSAGGASALAAALAQLGVEPARR